MIRRIETLNDLADLNVAFWIYSRDTRSFSYISPAVSNIFETDIAAITDIRVFKKVVHPDDQTRVIRNLNGGYSSTVDELEYRIITPKGKVKWLKNTAVTVRGRASDSNTVIGCTYVKTKESSRGKQGYFVNTNNLLGSLPGSYLIIDKKGRILQGLINRADSLLRRSAGPFIGKTFSRVLDISLSRKIRNRLNDPSVLRDAVVLEQRLTGEGNCHWFEVRMLQLSPDAFVIYMRNITELWNKVNRTEKFYNIAEQSDEMIMMTDVTGTIEYVNPKLEQVSGYKAGELLGKKAGVFRSGKHDREFYTELWRTVLQGKTFKAEFHNLSKEGDLFIEEKVITPLLDQGKITNFISTGRDVTLHKKKELKANKYRQLQDTIAEKEQKSQTLSLIKRGEYERKKFASDIHEGVSQMLSAAMINLEGLAGKQLMSEGERDKIQMINHMVSEIINELRGISTDLSPSGLYKFGLHSVIQQMVEKYKKSRLSAQIKFTSNIKDLRFKNEIEINLYRIVEEAIKNVIRHSKANQLQLSLNYESTFLKLLVRDNGEGINMNVLEFKKANTFGILSIEARAKSIGAELSIHSKKDNGFTINLRLQTKTLNT